MRLKPHHKSRPQRVRALVPGTYMGPALLAAGVPYIRYHTRKSPFPHRENHHQQRQHCISNITEGNKKSDVLCLCPVVVGNARRSSEPPPARIIRTKRQPLKPPTSSPFFNLVFIIPPLRRLQILPVS
ncbi:predicted protein [Histoplasma capsulatum G186AR]|uniref:Uncharacterized protein n=1 Tax=Ajellomyces capsulatus (strain G186AR / H82 / ATCC MYA-2454 / RMSCC 2432) TaxID=447093 RepID=C0NRP5_AJECG|nr:uncharacterized protein HCBG_05825 [Histoplasma capsulatum G186AR]EEH05561.1 predicted protein [Histoplasma capsulatum G186AR]